MVQLDLLMQMDMLQNFISLQQAAMNQVSIQKQRVQLQIQMVMELPII